MSWISHDLDLLPNGRETAATIEGQGLRAVEGAGMDVEPGNRMRPCRVDRMIHQKPSCAAADQGFGQAEKGQFTLISDADIQFHQSFGGAVFFQ